MKSCTQVTQLIEQAQAGDTGAAAALLPVVYAELRRLAAAELSRESAGHTLAPTALVHEAYLRLVGSDIVWEGRRPFFCAAATAIRRILVDHARHRDAEKRGGGVSRQSLEQAQELVSDPTPAPGEPLVAVLPLHEALQRLEKISPRQAEVVLLRYFGGLGVEQTALALNVSSSTVKNDWAFAKAWLRRELSEKT